MSFHVVATVNADKFNGMISIKLNKEICLRGDWEVALIDSNLSLKNDESFFVFCDLVNYSYYNENCVQLLGVCKIKIEKFYMRLIKKRFSTINMEIKKDLHNDTIPTILDNSYFILHFRKL